MKEFVEHKIFHAISEAACELGLETYVIGGYVRDKILKRKDPKDIDFVAVGSGMELAKKVAEKLKKTKVNYFKNFGTAQLKYDNYELEFVGARKESYQRDSRKPLVENGTLQDDLNRRDFTINAMGISLNKDSYGQLLDPFNGRSDLEKGIIRTPLDPDITYSDDPLRMMRAIRFATQLYFDIYPTSLKAIKNNAYRLSIISAERIQDEMHKIMLAPKPSVGLKLLFETGLLKEFLPEVVALQGVEEIEGQSHKDNFYHTVQVVDNVAKRSESLWLRYAALFHDIGKPVTKKFVEGTGWTFHNHEYIGSKMVYTIFRRLRFPLGEPLKYVQLLVKLSSRPIAVADEQATDSAARRLLFDAGDHLEDLMILCESDITTRNKKKKERFLQNFQKVRQKLKQVEEKDHLRNWQPPISGEEIMATFQLGPGKEIGIIKEAIKEAILEGDIQNNYEAAREFMLKKGSELGLNAKQQPK